MHENRKTGKILTNKQKNLTRIAFNFNFIKTKKKRPEFALHNFSLFVSIIYTKLVIIQALIVRVREDFIVQLDF